MIRFLLLLAEKEEGQKGKFQGETRHQKPRVREREEKVNDIRNKDGASCILIRSERERSPSQLSYKRRKKQITSSPNQDRT